MSCTILMALLLALIGATTSAVESGDQVIVVYNTRLPASKEVAEYYAKRRQVPDSHVLGFDLPTTEVMTRPEFRSLLQRPLFNYLVLRGLWTLALPETVSETAVPGQWIAQSSVRYLVLCHGVPLKIQQDATLREERAANVPGHLNRNDAAVDSELTWLPLSRRKIMLTGPMPNPYFATTNLRAMHPTNGLLLVARLDGPTPEIARGLVDKAIEGETHGLWGRAYFDARGLTNGQYLLGDEWMRRAAHAAREVGIETTLEDKPETFSQTFPMSHIAFYAGWYDGDVSGPFTRPQVEFMPGAFAYHLHSFSATTIRSASQHWVGPLLAKGVTATVGYVEEPFLPYTSDVPTLFQSLILRGGSFGEAAWSAERAISWQT
ncbi:MAG: TIGR03790 family protein, partial [Verrucomicrobia bacterium]|nr:TIGR03790 family protein [Verrucomicrobiota bacterium]